MVYEWESKRAVCYRLYIEEKKSLEDIIEIMRTEYQFCPSKRAFQTQFKRWGFPSKQNPAHKNVDLVARVKDLWERNENQRDMLRILNEEGYEIKERELMRLRSKNRWLLRVPNGMKAGSVDDGEPLGDGQNHHDHDHNQSPDQPPTPAVGEQDGLMPGTGAEGMEHDAAATAAAANAEMYDGTTKSLPLEPMSQAKRQERLARLQEESDARWATKKRRRRTRGWAGLPADPPGPPRFPSETTLDESKMYLCLDEATYREVREQFQRICTEAGFAKKTAAGAERWQAAKDRLVRESAHLQAMLWTAAAAGNVGVGGGGLEAKTLALDVVCTDVTKRMRTLSSRMTIAAAKNALGINPEESRRIRNAFYDALRADCFTSKLEMGHDRWRELKRRWIQDSPILQRILAADADAADPERHALKLKAVEVLCRDVMKRLRDDQAKRDPSKRQFFTTRGNAQARTFAAQALARSRTTAHGGDPANANANAHNTNSASNSPGGGAQHLAAMQQIDPSLIQAAANDPAYALAAHHQHHHHHHHHQVAAAAVAAAAASSSSSSAASSSTASAPAAESAAAPFGYSSAILDPSPPHHAHHPQHHIPVFLRVHPQSTMHAQAKTWLGKLASRSVDELRLLGALKFKDARVARIEGTLRDDSGAEICFLISEDHELDAYLTHVEGRTATFAFLLQPA
ncbi:hypothetical protein LOZ39_002565 [Ophidiomyces ophidiicola]|nr:hypothetical protein LOZ61_003367 [Ophidiomyces ophidiicola]KAI1920269.1 hypothetical protein LOZ64_001896 [Ophidiomyces ophidiicola]KAI1924121.1 hypothetical protein LOZ60_004880 [Ophidiomyces ophidiicola]KAI1960012.1 hypothetical protein LOZ59_002959 [Ophidiomyces ophidiicola]KAI2006222.1 hypothetical protein LOZ49_005117 [Ophidiomyces ophidiicola]